MTLPPSSLNDEETLPEKPMPPVEEEAKEAVKDETNEDTVKNTPQQPHPKPDANKDKAKEEEEKHNQDPSGMVHLLNKTMNDSYNKAAKDMEDLGGRALVEKVLDVEHKAGKSTINALSSAKDTVVSAGQMLIDKLTSKEEKAESVSLQENKNEQSVELQENNQPKGPSPTSSI